VSTQEHILERLRRLEEKIEALQLICDEILIDVRRRRQNFRPTIAISVTPTQGPPCTH
jgi:hypothetical protein